MTIPPAVESPEDARPFFAALRILRDEIAAESGAQLPILSMGMSGDFGAAIEEGATLVRIGTAIFGASGESLKNPRHAESGGTFLDFYGGAPSSLFSGRPSETLE